MDYRKINRTAASRNGLGRLLVGSSLALSMGLLASANLQAEEKRTSVLSREEVQIDVLFEGDCPRDVSTVDVLLSKKKTKRVRFVAIDADSLEPVSRAFQVYVHPFKGGSWSTTNGELLINEMVVGDAPDGVLYKYTITNGKPTADCPAVDPYWRVR